MSGMNLCTCGWPDADAEPGSGHCHLCHDTVPTHDLLGHIRVMHPEQYGDGPERWPDGHVVIEHAEITPADFTGDPA